MGDLYQQNDRDMRMEIDRLESQKSKIIEYKYPSRLRMKYHAHIALPSSNKKAGPVFNFAEFTIHCSQFIPCTS